MSDVNNKKIEKEIKQKKNGFFEIRKLKIIKLNATEIVGATIRTSEGENRIELARVNELGFPSEGLYLYSGGVITTVITANTIFFYDLDGNIKGAIQMPTAGNGAISFDQLSLIGGSSGQFSIIISDSGFEMVGLPTSNPGGSGLLWSDGGTIKIT